MHHPSASPYKVLSIELATLVKGVNELLRFVLELGMLAAFAYWGAHVVSNTVARVITAIATPAIAATVWGLVLSPRAPAKLSSVFRLTFSLPVFLLAALATYASGMPRSAIAFAVVSTVNTVILIALDDVVGTLQRATQGGDDEHPRRPIE
jgi:hypothetical protein